MDNFIFSDEQYLQLQTEYAKQLNTAHHLQLNRLDDIITNIENNNFGLDLSMQNTVKSDLIQAKQILEILHLTPNQNSNYISDSTSNPFELVYMLSTLSYELNNEMPSSPYQLIFSKANKLITNCIIEIANYFKNKNIKVFKFL